LDFGLPSAWASARPSLFGAGIYGSRAIQPHAREDIQEPFVREQQIDPQKYYPKGCHPELLEEWPVDSDLVVPYEAMPPAQKKSMSDRWRQKVKNQKILEEQAR
jgi:hypothetical protein